MILASILTKPSPLDKARNVPLKLKLILADAARLGVVEYHLPCGLEYSRRPLRLPVVNTCLDFSFRPTPDSHANSRPALP